MPSDDEDLIRALERLLAGNASERETQRVEKAARAGRISVASGTRSVGVAGDVSDSLIVTGDSVSINLAFATPNLSRPEWSVIEDVINLQGPKHFCLRQAAGTVYNSCEQREVTVLPAYVKIIIIMLRSRRASVPITFTGDTWPEETRQKHV